MKQFIIAATVALTTVGAANAGVWTDKVDQAIQDYGAAAVVYEFQRAQDMANDRLNEFKSEIVPALTEYLYGTSYTYDEIVDLYAEDVIDNIHGYRYQTNSDGTRLRIKLVNADGTYFNDDWIYASNVSELIRNLAVETFEEGFKDGYDAGFYDGYVVGYTEGYDDGWRDAEARFGG